MNNSVNLGDITDIKELKALLADLFMQRDQHIEGEQVARKNIEMVILRINQISESDEKTSTEIPKAKK